MTAADFMSQISEFVTTYQEILSGLAGGAFVTFLIVWIRHNTRTIPLKQKVRELEEKISKEKQSIENLNAEVKQLEKEKGEEEEENQTLMSQIKVLLDEQTEENKLRRYWYPVELFWKKPINKEAFECAFEPIQEYLEKHRPSYRLLAEVGMGGFIDVDEKCGTQEERKKVFNDFGYKRVDFLVLNHCGEPVLAIEYDGSGHKEGEDADKAREQKAMALKAVNIPLIIVDEKEEPESVCGKLRECLDLGNC